MFVAKTPSEGHELWVTDGSPAQTRLVRDIYPGPLSSDPSELTVMNGFVYFAALNLPLGNELWRTDGSAAGTVVVQDIVPGRNSSSPKELAVAPNGVQLLFQANDGFGTELFESRGTAATTVRLADINVGPRGSDPRDFVNVGALTLFSATDGSNGHELWVTDGTLVGTGLLRDIFPGFDSGLRLGLRSTKVGNLIYFAAKDPSHGTELWCSDGTATGTVLVTDLNAGSASSDPNELRDVGGYLAFGATTVATGREPYALVPGLLPILIADVEPGPGGSTPRQFSVSRGGLIFSAYVGGTFGLWNVGSTVSSIGGIAAGFNLTPFNTNELLLTAEGPEGYELWLSDGTTAGTRLVADIAPGMSSASADVRILSDVTVDGRIFFIANDGQTGTELWSFRPGEQPILLGDLEVGPNGSVPRFPIHAETFTVFNADTAATGRELFVTDGTSPAILLHDIVPGSTSGIGLPGQGHALRDLVIFPANDGVTGTELWVTDGTQNGTQLLLDVAAGAASSSPTNFLAWRGKLYFCANTPAAGTEIWVTDGTAAGTVQMIDLESGPTSSRPILLTEFDNELWFRATTAATGTELWRTDGTAAGTRLAFDLAPGAASSQANGTELVVAGNRIVFNATLPGSRRDLFVSDGTLTGTLALLPTPPGPQPSLAVLPQITAADGQVFFVGQETATGRELWVTDLTLAGTRMVVDLYAGSRSSVIRSLRAVGRFVYFGASTPAQTDAVWVSDGTAAGTVTACGELAPSLSNNSQMFGFVQWDGALYAPLLSPVVGTEMFVISNPGAMVEDFRDSCPTAWARLDASAPVLGGTLTIQGANAPANQIGFTTLAVGSTPAHQPSQPPRRRLQEPCVPCPRGAAVHHDGELDRCALGTRGPWALGAGPQAAVLLRAGAKPQAHHNQQLHSNHGWAIAEREPGDA